METIARLLLESIRYGERPEVRARLDQVVEQAFDRGHLQDLLEERAIAHDAMDASRVHRIREDMERAEARRLQPHYIESFFLEAFQRLGGTSNSENLGDMKSPMSLHLCVAVTGLSELVSRYCLATSELHLKSPSCSVGPSPLRHLFVPAIRSRCEH